MNKNYTKIILDLMMAITFVLLMNPRVLNGLPFHEIVGLIIGVAILTHIGLNYRWVLNTTKKVFDPTLPKKNRFSFLLNILLLLSMASVIITGIFISRVVFPSLAIQEGHAIRGIHGFSADTTLVLVGLHVGIHWQWIISICKKAFKSKDGKLRRGILASVVLTLTILIGGIQWYSTTISPSADNFKQEQIQQNGQFANNGNTGNTAFSQQVPPNKNIHGGKGEFQQRGEHRSISPILVVLNYFAIWAAIIIPTYFLEMKILRKKRKSRNIQPKESY